jgi:hypothetical protein
MHIVLEGEKVRQQETLAGVSYFDVRTSCDSYNDSFTHITRKGLAIGGESNRSIYSTKPRAFVQIYIGSTESKHPAFSFGWWLMAGVDLI